MGVNNSLLKSIQTIVDKEVESASFDKTRQAQVIGNNADGTYTVRLDGVLYNNVSSYPKSVSITEGSVVKIVTPSNQPSQMYIITPKGGGGGDHLEITQEDYDDLPTDKKQGDTVFFVTESEPEYLIMSDSVPIGAIQSYGGNVAPSGWLICDGSAISRTEYSELFYVIGTTYGSGDGSTTFNIPDLKGRTLVGVGNSGATGATNHTLGQKSGEETHDHLYALQFGGYYQDTIMENDAYAGVLNYRTNTPVKGVSVGGYAVAGNSGTTTAIANVSAAHYKSEGYSSSVSNMQPYLVVNYIIKAKQPPTENVIKGLDPQEVLIDAFCPVGSYYETSDISFDPNISWGGIWTKLPTDFSESKKLLWTNPNVEANYDGGTVSLNLSDYDEVDILCYAGGQIVDRLQVPVGSVGKLSEVGGTGGYNSGAITVITRLCTVSNSGVVFTSAYLGYDGQALTQGFNHNLKPFKIYGIKQTTSYCWHRTA